MTTALTFMIFGAGLGIGLAYLIRRYRAAAHARRPPPPQSFVSRQDQRKHERQLLKRQESERRLRARRDKAAS